MPAPLVYVDASRAREGALSELKDAIADLGDADLTAADLTHANLAGANLAGAIFCHTTMRDGRINNSGC